MKKLAVLALSLAGLTSTYANASNWLFVDRSPYQQNFYIDMDSIHKSKGYTYAFTKAIYDTPFYGGGTAFNVSIVYVEFDCKSKPRRWRNLMMKNFLNNRVTSQGNLNESFQPIYPDTIGYRMSNIICSY